VRSIARHNSTEILLKGGSLEKREVNDLSLSEYIRRLRLKNMPNLILTNFYKALP
jgi:hypothetical protein